MILIIIFNYLLTVDRLNFLASFLPIFSAGINGDIYPSMERVHDRFVFPISRAPGILVGKIFGKNVLVIILLIIRRKI